jgi:DUF971 family protein
VIELVEGGAALRITHDGEELLLAAAMLRRACRCAACRADERRGVVVDAQPATILTCNEVGAYAVQLCFSDGHERGVYPYVYLSQLAAG